MSPNSMQSIHPILRELKQDLLTLRRSVLCKEIPSSASAGEQIGQTEQGQKQSGGPSAVPTSQSDRDFSTKKTTAILSPGKAASQWNLRKDKILDSNLNLAKFCKSLEAAFKHGLKASYNDNFFIVFDAIAKEPNREQGLNALVRHIITEIHKHKCLRTNTGRARYFLRCCLANGWITSLVMSLRTWTGITKYYQIDSLILRSANESIMDVFPILEILNFDLILTNKSFLDYGWDLPVYRKFELVPTNDLGLMICTIRGRVIVTAVKPLSVAGEDGKVAVGDVIEDIDSITTFALQPEDVATIVKKCYRRPIVLGVTKAEWHCHRVFPHLRPFLTEADLDVKAMEEKWRKKASKKKKNNNRSSFFLDPGIGGKIEDGEDEFNPLLEDESDHEQKESSSKCGKPAGQEILYVGSLRVGCVGDSSVLDCAIQRVIHDNKKVHHSVRLQLLELGVKMFGDEDKDNSDGDEGNLVLDYTFPEISACGCYSSDNHYLAFIAGNDHCSVATDFLCHVFYTANVAKARAIITAIAEGFDRTRNAV